MARSTFARLSKERGRKQDAVLEGNYVRFYRERDKSWNGPVKVLMVNRNKLIVEYKGILTSAARSNARIADPPFRTFLNIEEIEDEPELEPEPEPEPEHTDVRKVTRRGTHYLQVSTFFSESQNSQYSRRTFRHNVQNTHVVGTILSHQTLRKYRHMRRRKKTG
jgi:hypothetical protein